MTLNVCGILTTKSKEEDFVSNSPAYDGMELYR